MVAVFWHLTRAQMTKASILKSFKERSKKRMMYLVDEDFYFITYNCLFILNKMGCFSEKKAFKDYKKLAYLIDFIANKKLTSTMTIGDGFLVQNSFKEELIQSYVIGMSRASLLARVAFALEQKGILVVKTDLKKHRVDWFINKDTLPVDFFDQVFFLEEDKNYSLMTEEFKLVRTASLKTTLDFLYGRHGILIWLD